jgi:hypothetical protein
MSRFRLWWVVAVAALLASLTCASCSGDEDARVAKATEDYSAALQNDEIAKAEIELEDAKSAAASLGEVAMRPGATDLQRDIAAEARKQASDAQQNLDSLKQGVEAIGKAEK